MEQRWKKEFRERYQRHGAELKRPYLELYHRDQQAYACFLDMLYRSWVERSAALKKPDRKRLRDANWYKDHEPVGTLIYVNAFAGDLAALAEDCHSLGIAVCLDFVMSHTSEDHRAPGYLFGVLAAGRSSAGVKRPCCKARPKYHYFQFSYLHGRFFCIK